MNNEDVLKWKKRLNKKGPFYLYSKDTKPHIVYEWDNTVKPPTRIDINTTKNIYTVIWNDGAKTKLGSLEDWMHCRYGINTWATLKGDTVFDLWNGECVNDESFKAMLEVRHHTSNLPHFSLDTLIGLTH